MKIILIAPQVTRPLNFDHNRLRVSPFFPLGIACLSAVLIEAGYEVEVRDYLINYFTEEGTPYGASRIRYGASDGHIVEDLRASQADVVGISCLFAAQEYDAKLLCQLAREALPNAFVVMGGPHAGASALEFMRDISELDGVIEGEGEISTRELFRALEGDKDLSKIDGLTWRSKDGGIVRQRKTQYIENLDALPMPARYLFDMKLYFEKGKGHNVPDVEPCAQVVTSRGCPYRCTFCALGNHWGKRQRLRSAKHVLEEIRLLVDEYGVKEIHFEDDNLTANKERALEIFRGMRDAQWDLQWNAPSGLSVAKLDEELLVAMKDSGCYSVSLAIESGDQDVLSNLMRKPVNLEKVPETVRLVRKCGLLAKGFFILGYPGETKETMQKTVDFARSLELDWAFFFIATPLPHTEMWNMCVEKGYFDPADFDPVTSILRCQIHSPDFTPEEVEELREKAIIDCNFVYNPNLLKYDVNQAIKDFKGVLKTYPNFDFAHLALGKAYSRLGLKKESLDSWREAVRINPDNQEALRLLKKT